MEGKAGPTWFVDFPGAGFFFFFFPWFTVFQIFIGQCLAMVLVKQFLALNR